MTIKVVVNNAFNNKDYNDVIGIIISEENYDIINPIQSELEEGYNIKRMTLNSFPFVLPFFTDAYYIYTYIVIDTDTNEVIYGTSGLVTVDLDFYDFWFHISDVEITA